VTMVEQSTPRSGSVSVEEPVVLVAVVSLLDVVILMEMLAERGTPGSGSVMETLARRLKVVRIALGRPKYVVGCTSSTCACKYSGRL
jgi:hypothetical protein